MAQRTPARVYASVAAIALSTLLVGSLCIAPQQPIAPATASRLDVHVQHLDPNGVALSWARVRGMTGVTIRAAVQRTPSGALVHPVLLASLDESAQGYELNEIPPGTGALISVEMSLPTGVERAVLDVSVAPKRRADQREPLRGAYFVAPKILALVIANGDGEEYEAAEWSVRSDRGPIAVTSVHRFSVPVGQPNYELGYRARDELEPVEVDHTLYLTLESAPPPRTALLVEGPVRAVVPFDDTHLETPVVQLNQVGYNPRATKRWAYVSGWMGDGGPLSLADFPESVEVIREDGSVVATLPLTPRAPHDAASGTEVREVDLSRVPAAEGVDYRIRVPGVGVSFPTRIDERAAFKAYYVVARGLFHNRWAGDLRADCTEWTRPPDHGRAFTAEQEDAFDMLPESTPQTNPREVRGGHHDAGDFDLRPTHTVVPQVLMRAYELAPSHFTDGQLTIPESHNRIPDLLDEALWNVASWEALQESDGGVRGGVESWRHPWGTYFANEEPLPYWTFARNANVSARMAGVFAQASRLVAPFDATHAAVLRDRAVRAYRYAKTHGGTDPFLIYGASELARLTGEAQYLDAFRAHWNAIGPDGIFSGYANEHLEMGDYRERGRVMPDYVLGLLASDRVPPDLRETALRWMDNIADQVATTMLESGHAHRNPWPTDRPGFGWGQATSSSRYMDPIFARLQMGGLEEATRQRYFDALSVAADYLLGANPAGFVYITGLGSRSPEEPLHLDSLAWLKRGRPPVPGIPVYGPVSELPAADYYDYAEREFHPAFAELPPLRRYGDVRSFVTTSEFSVWEMSAPYAEHFATLIGDAQTPPRSWLPGGPDHANPLP